MPLLCCSSVLTRLSGGWHSAGPSLRSASFVSNKVWGVVRTRLLHTLVWQGRTGHASHDAEHERQEAKQGTAVEMVSCCCGQLSMQPAALLLHNVSTRNPL